jgi:hypothetical protein
MIRFEHVNRDVLTDDMTEMLRNNPPDVVYAAFRDAFFKNAIRMVQRDNEMRNIVLTDAAAREKATRQGEPTQTIPTGFAESKQARDQEEAPWRGSNRGFRKHRQTVARAFRDGRRPFRRQQGGHQKRSPERDRLPREASPEIGFDAWAPVSREAQRKGYHWGVGS